MKGEMRRKGLTRRRSQDKHQAMSTSMSGGGGGVELRCMLASFFILCILSQINYVINKSKI